jgi:cell division septation protein DedD
MAFWNKSPDANTPAAVHEQLENTQQALSQARRRLLGAAVLLVLACALIPWMLDSTPRPWGEDVILRMPKSEQPYQAKPTAPLPPIVPATDAKPSLEAKP